MKRIFNRTRIGLILMLLLIPSPICAQTLSEQISAGIEQVKKAGQSPRVSSEAREDVNAELKGAEVALRSGHTYLSLYLLEKAWPVMLWGYAGPKLSLEKQGLPAFHREWRRLGTQLTAKQVLLDDALLAKSPAKLPLAINALIQIDRTKSKTYYDVSDTSGENFGVRSALIYMGIADAQLDFALFCQELNVSTQTTNPGLRSLAPAIERLEAKILDSYKQHDTPELVEENIALSSNKELASQLDKSGRFDGALIAYLDTYLKLGLLDVQAPAPDRIRELNAELDKMGERLKESGMDHSIGLMYWAMAKTALAGGTLSTTQATAQLKKAAALVEQVLPAYFNYMAELKPEPALVR